jgi:catechol 2,3-dioxygenase-like lactoylglutathione lyase family enzyme
VKIELNHTIVPARDKEKSARFYERIFGFKYEGPMGHFAPFRIPSQSLSLDFDNRKSFQPHHYAFQVGGGRIR